MLDISIEKFAVWNGRNIYMLREDLLPVACGGNKVRIALKLIADARSMGATAIVGYGNSRSNLCRVLAMLCAREKVKCVVISPSDEDGTIVDTINSRIVRLCGAEVVHCDKGASVADVVERTMDGLQEEGLVPYYIFGDKFGHGNELILTSAYEEVAVKIVDWERLHGIKFDQVALAVGTGATYAGLINGFRSVGRDVSVLGFTIARDVQRCKEELARFTSEKVDVSDVALNGGYGRSSSAEDGFLREVVRTYAIMLDSTYAGKALWGLHETCHGTGTTLFVNSGSLPLAFDSLRQP